MAKKKKNRPAGKQPPVKQNKSATSNFYIFGIAVLALLIIGLIFFISDAVLRNKGTGSTANQNQNITREIENFESTLRGSPNDLQTMLKLAHLYLDNKQYDKANELYDKVLQLEPRNVEAIAHIGNIEGGRQNITAAIEKYDQALKIQPGYAHALWDKGLLMRSLGRYEESIALFERFLKLIPTGQDAETVTKWIEEMKIAN